MSGIMCNIIGKTRLTTTERAYYNSNKSYVEITNRLGEYEDLDAQGLLLRLPCKVGDTVYLFGCEGEILEGICKAIQVDEETRMLFVEGKNFAFWRKFERFGTSVFLTKEEAEQKLASMQKGE